MPMINVLKRRWKTERRVATFRKNLWLVILLASLVEANGQEDDDSGFEFWSRIDIRWITKSVQHDFEFQYRNQQRVAALPERFQLYTFRWYILKRWDKFYVQSSPVTFFERLTNDGVLVNEYRLTQNIGWFLFEDKFQIRAGVEGRFFWSEGEHAEEVRSRSRLQYSIPVSKKLKVVVGDEIFFRKRLSGDDLPVFDQNRASLGINYKLTDKVMIDTGYQFHNRSFVEHETDNFNVAYFYMTYQI